MASAISPEMECDNSYVIPPPFLLSIQDYLSFAAVVLKGKMTADELTEDDHVISNFFNLFRVCSQLEIPL